MSKLLGAHQTMTIWNKYRNDGLDAWQRHIVPDCTWRKTSIKTISASGIANIADYIVVLISDNKSYMTFDDWKLLSDDGKKYFFTIQTGDLVALGKYSIEILLDSPYREIEVKELLKPDVINIKSFRVNNFDHMLGKHIKLEGV
ncbi:MAG: hypothetical protein FWC41_01570 [Firmicutes bacterium]|nr:hypothetical protein [Bacillota bacterium]